MTRKLKEVTGVKGEVRSFGRSDKLVCSSTLVGIEIEMERGGNFINSVPKANYWSQVSEGSLRNGGIEVVTPPVMGSDIITALDEFSSMYTKCNNKPVITERTGFHVHVDFREETVQCLFRFIVLYIIFEKHLFAHCEDGREDNPYCVPLGDCVDLLKTLPNLLSHSNSTSRSVIQRYPKYTAMNIAPLTSLGTIEVRSHEGTVDTTSILEWVNLILCLKKYAKENEFSPQKLIDLVCSDSAAYFSSVFSGYSRVPYSEKAREGMLIGARVAQQMYRAKEIPSCKSKDSLVSSLYKEVSSVKKPSMTRSLYL